MIRSMLTRFARTTTFALCTLLAFPSAAAAGETTVYSGGRVWTGAGFTQHDLAVRDGRFIDPIKAGSGARVVPLDGSYVVPAYANAHTHLTAPTEAGSRSFTDAGVFYAWNPNTNIIPPVGQAFFARPDTFDVRIAQGGITEPGGHPEELYSRYIFPGRSVASLVGDAFHYGQTPAQIDAALDLLVRQGANFVKGFLSFSEEHGTRRTNGGLTPANARYLVEAAGRRGLKVVFHTETIADFRAAMDAGGHAAMHLPAYGLTFTDETPDKWALTEEDAQRAARSGILIVPTYGLIHGFDGSVRRGAIEERQRAVQARNLRLLAAAGATLLTGTDKRGEIFSEAEHLASLNALQPLHLVQIVLGTGRHLFPDRRIGCFEAGCEADFLVLADDPVADIRALRSIRLRIKAGRELQSGRSN